MYSTMKVATMMELFEHRYYKLNIMFMQLIGQWPYLKTHVRFVILAIAASTAVTYLIPQLLAIVTYRDDWDIIMESGVGLLFCAFVLIKIFTFIFNSQKMRILLHHIHNDWKVWAQDRDVCILHEYTEKGRKITFAYAIMCYATCILFVIQPIIPKIIDVLLNNGTETGQFPTPIDYYYIDMQKYYFYIILHCYVYASMGFISSMTYDCMFMVFVQHGCGLFAALRRKLQRIGKNEKSVKRREISHAMDNPDVDLQNLGWCIDRHRDAIEYADYIEASYSWCFFSITGINMLLISLTGLQIVKRTGSRQQTVRFIVANVLSMGHLYVDNYMAQILMEHSTSIHYYILNGEWYQLPVKVQKIFLFIIMRCNVPCKLTAGKMIVLSIDTFVVILKTSLSYFTLLRSV